MPDVVICFFRRHVETIFLDVFCDFSDNRVERRKYFFVTDWKRCGFFERASGDACEHEPSDIPELVCKMLVSADFVFVKHDIVADCRPDEQAHAERVRAVFLYHLEWVDAVAERLAEFSSLRVAHDAVYQHGAKRRLAKVKTAHQYHSGHP